MILCLTSPPTAYLRQQCKVADFTYLKHYKFQFTSKVVALKIVKGHVLILLHKIVITLHCIILVQLLKIIIIQYYENQFLIQNHFEHIS